MLVARALAAAHRLTQLEDAGGVGLGAGGLGAHHHQQRVRHDGVRPRPRLRVDLDAGDVVGGGGGLVSGGRDVDLRPDWAGHLGLGLHTPNIDLDTAALLRRSAGSF